MEKLTEVAAYLQSVVGQQEFVILTGASIALAFTGAAFSTRRLWKIISGKLRMKKRERLKREMSIILEDGFVDAMSKGIEHKLITTDDARILYGRLSMFGLWGLHPRKLEIRKSPEQLAELKAKLQAKRASKKSTVEEKPSSVIDKMLDGLEAELG